MASARLTPRRQTDVLTYAQSFALVGLMLAVNLAIVALTVRALRKQARDFRRRSIRRTLEVIR
jgi:hypothetical protein